jgi:hypothetical protein
MESTAAHTSQRSPRALEVERRLVNGKDGEVYLAALSYSDVFWIVLGMRLRVEGGMNHD